MVLLLVNFVLNYVRILQNVYENYTLCRFSGKLCGQVLMMACIFFPLCRHARKNFWDSSEGVEGQSAKGKNVDGVVNHWEPPQRFIRAASGDLNF